MTPETAERVDRLAEAIRIVAVKTGYGYGDALSMILDRAQASHCTPDTIASGIILGTIRFDETPEPQARAVRSGQTNPLQGESSATARRRHV